MTTEIRHYSIKDLEGKYLPASSKYPRLVDYIGKDIVVTDIVIDEDKNGTFVELIFHLSNSTQNLESRSYSENIISWAEVVKKENLLPYDAVVEKFGRMMSIR